MLHRVRDIRDIYTANSS